MAINSPRVKGLKHLLKCWGFFFHQPLLLRKFQPHKYWTIFDLEEKLLQVDSVALTDQNSWRTRSHFREIQKQAVPVFVGCTCLLCASSWWAYCYQNICSASAGVLSLGFADVTIAYTQLEKCTTCACWRYWFWKCRIWAKVHFEPHLEQCNLNAHRECVIRLVRCSSYAAE